MQTELPEAVGDCSWVVVTHPRHESLSAPLQLSFLSPVPDVIVGPDDSLVENDPEFANIPRRLRRRRCRTLKKEDVEEGQAVPSADGRVPAAYTNARALLRKPSGEYIPPLYSHPITVDAGGDIRGISELFEPADPETIIASADALLSSRLKHGVKILRDPYLLRRFLRLKLVTQRQPIFAAFFVDRKQRLIKFAEIARGADDYVHVYPKEIVRDAFAYGAEQVLCVRSDPRGDHQPTSQDCEDARRVKQALDLVHVPLMDYLIVGQEISSLRLRGII